MAGLASLSSKLRGRGPGEKAVNAVLMEANDLGEPVFSTALDENDPAIGPLGFQYFPESISDTKGINYQRKDIPGASLPLYQWISSGERVISFNAVFSSDTTLIANDLTLDTTLIDRHKSVGVRRRNVDIRAAVAWLRRFMLPTYEADGSQVGVPITKAPRKAFLLLKNSGIGIAGGFSISNPDMIACIMTQCDVTYESFFPTGIPRVASVSLSFAEIAQQNDLVRFPDRSPSMADAIAATSVYTAGYYISGTDDGEGNF